KIHCQVSITDCPRMIAIPLPLWITSMACFYQARAVSFRPTWRLQFIRRSMAMCLGGRACGTSVIVHGALYYKAFPLPGAGNWSSFVVSCCRLDSYYDTFVKFCKIFSTGVGHRGPHTCGDIVKQIFNRRIRWVIVHFGPGNALFKKHFPSTIKGIVFTRAGRNSSSRSHTEVFFILSTVMVGKHVPRRFKYSGKPGPNHYLGFTGSQC